MDRRCRRNDVAGLSSNTSWILAPRDEEMASAFGSHDPRVSMATGTNSYPWSSAEYFAFLLVSAVDAADSSAIELWLICDRVTVSGQVKSQTNIQPVTQGITVTPSGFLPSERRRPRGLFIIIIIIINVDSGELTKQRIVLTYYESKYALNDGHWVCISPLFRRLVI